MPMKQIHFVLKEIKDWHVYMFLLYRKATSKCHLRSRRLNSDLLEIHGKVHSAFSKIRFGNKCQVEYVLPLIPLILVLEEPFHAWTAISWKGFFLHKTWLNFWWLLLVFSFSHERAGYFSSLSAVTCNQDTIADSGDRETSQWNKPQFFLVKNRQTLRCVLYIHQALLWLLIIFPVAMFCHFFGTELPISVPINGPTCPQILRQNPRCVTCSLGHRDSTRDGPDVHFFLGEAWRFPLLALFSIERE